METGLASLASICSVCSSDAHFKIPRKMCLVQLCPLTVGWEDLCLCHSEALWLSSLLCMSLRCTKRRWNPTSLEFYINYPSQLLPLLYSSHREILVPAIKWMAKQGRMCMAYSVPKFLPSANNNLRILPSEPLANGKRRHLKFHSKKFI